MTSLDEAIPLREASVRANILLMTGFWRGEESEIIRLHLTPTVWEPWHIELMESAASALGVAEHPVHLKVDTGMGRLGVGVEQLPVVLAALKTAKHLVLEGLSTHLASSEIMDAPSVAEQERSFDVARRTVREAGMEPRFVHMANTGAVISRRETWQSMVRPGVALLRLLFAISESGARGEWRDAALAGQACAYVEDAHSVAARFRSESTAGLWRDLCDEGSGACCGAARRLCRWIQSATFEPWPRDCAGALCTDRRPYLDGPDAGGRHGEFRALRWADEVILLGAGEGLSVDALEHAELASSTPYEILCNISKRVPRRYGS